jgi:ATP-dependent DNA helicase DinG
MLEARAHQQLKHLLQQEGLRRWPHHFTLSRLVARSLRRADHTLIRLAPGSDPGWLISLLVPLALAEVPLALICSEQLRQRLLQVEWPRLTAAGMAPPCWQGSNPAPAGSIWLLSPEELVRTWRQGLLEERQLVFAEAENAESLMRDAAAVVIEPSDWDGLRRSQPQAAASLLELHERLSRRILGQPLGSEQRLAIREEDEMPLRDLLTLLGPLPDPWDRWLEAAGWGWTSWARVDPTLLQWELHRQPLEPFEALDSLLTGRGVILAGSLPHGGAGAAVRPLGGQAFRPVVSVSLADPELGDPLPLYAPMRQPLPNSPHYGQHLLEQSRRLVLGQAGLTVVLLDDAGLQRGLASGLAAEFGSRVTMTTTAPEVNGVILCDWAWWLSHQQRLPLPCQIVVGLLPIASLEDPLTAARVQQLRRQGRDWFRELLLPEALGRLERGVAGLRQGNGRLAVLDGRLRSRSWGHQVLACLDPWSDLSRLLPS